MNSHTFVRRKSYGADLVFQLLSINPSGIAHLRGCTHRILADAPVSDLIYVRSRETEPAFTIVSDWKNLYLQKAETFQDTIRYPIRVLHIDSDPEYLDMCLFCYQTMALKAAGAVIEERRQPLEIAALLHRHHPDILIITGHDALPKGKDPKVLLNYKSSCYFAEAVKRAREYEPDPDRLIIFAGACQSYYEVLLTAGANYASSPGRILIHAMDPVIVCETIATTPFDTLIRSNDLAAATYSGSDGIGGYPTYGKARFTQ